MQENLQIQINSHVLGFRWLFNRRLCRDCMGLGGDVGLLIKAGLTIAFLFILYAMGPCGWMIGGTLLLFVSMKEQR